MPYTVRVRKRKKKRIYIIIRKRDGKKVGESTSMAKAQASIGHRMRGEYS
jgi:hypothetical protein